MSALAMAPYVAATLVCVLLGYLAASLLWPSSLSRGMLWCIAPLIGAGICSILYFAFRRPFVTVEFLLLALLAGLWLRLRKRGSHLPSFSGRGFPAIALLLAAALGLVVSGLVQWIDHQPHGGWDGWAIWGSHARHLSRDGPSWAQGIQYTFHPDYPLLIPGMTARIWRYAGEELPGIGGFVGLGFVIVGIGVLFATLTELRGPKAGAWYALVLTSTPFFVEHGISQYADIPLAVYFLATLALIALYFERAPNSRGLLVLAGFMAGCAAWTKNEGVLFVGAMSVLLLLAMLKRGREGVLPYSAYLAGLAIPLATIVCFRLVVGQQTDLLANRGFSEVVTKALSPERYMMVLKSASGELWKFGGWMAQPVIPLLFFAGARGFDGGKVRSVGWLVPAAAVILMMAGYFSVYILTPMDLRWHLDTSLPRLLIHLWPSFLLVVGLSGKQS